MTNFVIGIHVAPKILDRLFGEGLKKMLIERHVEDLKVAILSDFEYARNNDKEAHWYGPWSRVLAGFLSPIHVNMDHNLRIEGRPFAQHPVSADALDLDEYLKDALLRSTRYVDFMVVLLAHRNALESNLVPLSQPSPRVVLGVELKNPKRLLGAMSQSPPNLRVLFASVYRKQVVDQADHVFGSYRDGGWVPKVYLSIIICGEWMTYVEVTMADIARIKREKEEAELARQEEREGSTYDPAGTAPRVAKTHSRSKKTAGHAEAGRAAARTAAGSRSNEPDARKAQTKHSLDMEEWDSEDSMEDRDSDEGEGEDDDGDDDGTWTIGGPGPSAKEQLLEIFTLGRPFRPVELTGPVGWKVLSLIARRLTEPDVSGSMFPVGAEVMDKCHFDGHKEFSLTKAWVMRENERVKNEGSKEGRKGR